MRYHTIKEIEQMIANNPGKITIFSVYQENKWVVIELSSGVKLRIKNY